MIIDEEYTIWTIHKIWRPEESDSALYIKIVRLQPELVFLDI